MGVIRGNVGVIPGHLFKGTHPQVMRKDKHIGFGAEGQFLPLVAFPCIFKRIADTALNTFTRINHLLNRHLIGRAFFHKAAGPQIQSFGIFTDNHKIDVLRLFVCQGCLHVGIQFYRAQVDILVQAEPETEEYSHLKDPRFYLGMADRPQVDGIEFFQLVQCPRGQGLTCFKVVLTAKGEFFKGELYIKLL